MARSISLECVRTVLILLHPFSPFITEELWSYFRNKDSSDIIISEWKKTGGCENMVAEKNMGILKDIIIAIRSVRSRMNVAPSKYSDLVIQCKDNEQVFLNNHIDLLKSLGRIDEVSMGSAIDKPTQSATIISGGMELYIPLGGLVNLEEEKTRMEKRIIDINRLLSSIDSKLSNENFLKRAPESVVERERSNKEKLNEEFKKITKNMEMIQ
tara:strand:- start:830 stop:1465 length:636 start_codon:yes stop_codon:yes gene_type:complete